MSYDHYVDNNEKLYFILLNKSIQNILMNDLDLFHSCFEIYKKN